MTMSVPLFFLLSACCVLSACPPGWFVGYNSSCYLLHQRSLSWVQTSSLGREKYANKGMAEVILSVVLQSIERNGYVISAPKIEQRCALTTSDITAQFEKRNHYCLSLGGHLARIESETEKNLIRDELKHLSGHYWLDGIDDVIESDWRWASTYGKIEPTFWFPNEPSDTAANEDCMETHNDFRGLWNDLDCSSHLFSICEKEFLE